MRSIKRVSHETTPTIRSERNDRLAVRLRRIAHFLLLRRRHLHGLEQPFFTRRQRRADRAADGCDDRPLRRAGSMPRPACAQQVGGGSRVAEGAVRLPIPQPRDHTDQRQDDQHRGRPARQREQPAAPPHWPLVPRAQALRPKRVIAERQKVAHTFGANHKFTGMWVTSSQNRKTRNTSHLPRFEPEHLKIVCLLARGISCLEAPLEVRCLRTMGIAAHSAH